MRYLTLLCLLILAGCVSRQKEANSVNDVWCAGEALETYADVIKPSDLQNMGRFLKQFADYWAEQHNVTLQKEFNQ